MEMEDSDFKPETPALPSKQGNTIGDVLFSPSM
jgi:hypothetical protein